MGEFQIALINEAKASANSNGFTLVYHIMKALSGSHKVFDCPLFVLFKIKKCNYLSTNIKSRLVHPNVLSVLLHIWE